MPRWSPYFYPRQRCRCCGSDLAPRSRLSRHTQKLACQNYLCRDFDKPVDPTSPAVARRYGQ